jgi:hypothetical protein
MAEPRWTITVRAGGYEARHVFTGLHAETSARARWAREVSEMYAQTGARVLILRCGRRFERGAEQVASGRG